MKDKQMMMMIENEIMIKMVIYGDDDHDHLFLYPSLYHTHATITYLTYLPSWTHHM
jgi:hypothetical protein